MRLKMERKFYVLGLLLILCQFFVSAVWAENNAASIKQKRVEALKQDLQTITYGADRPKAVIYLLTDMNCSYCRKLHYQIPTLVDLGVEVRVLAMPRQGLNSPSYNTWVSIWCSPDPKEGLKRGMEGEEVALKQCENPIEKHYKLGKEWGVIGTPTVVFEDGTLRSGYFSPSKLAQEAIKRASVEH